MHSQSREVQVPRSIGLPRGVWFTISLQSCRVVLLFFPNDKRTFSVNFWTVTTDQRTIPSITCRNMFNITRSDTSWHSSGAHWPICISNVLLLILPKFIHWLSSSGYRFHSIFGFPWKHVPVHSIIDVQITGRPTDNVIKPNIPFCSCQLHLGLSQHFLSRSNSMWLTPRSTLIIIPIKSGVAFVLYAPAHHQLLCFLVSIAWLLEFSLCGWKSRK